MHLRNILVGSVLVLASACGGSSTPTTPSTPTPTPTPTPTANGTPVAIPAGAQSLGSNAYAPNPVTIPVGGTVTWTNSDTVPHTATSDGSAFNSGTINAGGKFSFTFPTAGTFSYHCSFHPGMSGSVVVQ